MVTTLEDPIFGEISLCGKPVKYSQSPLPEHSDKQSNTRSKQCNSDMDSKTKQSPTQDQSSSTNTCRINTGIEASRQVFQESEHFQKFTGSEYTNKDGDTKTQQSRSLPCLPSSSCTRPSQELSKGIFPPPLLGQHTRFILSHWLGYDDTKISYLIDNGVVRQHRVNCSV